MILLINPRLVVQKHDTFTTGIVYMPIGLAYFSDGLSKLGVEHEVLDLFGIDPRSVSYSEHTWIFGKQLRLACASLESKPSSIVIYANQAANHSDLTDILIEIRSLYPNVDVHLLENSQAVTAYSLKSVQTYFETLGVTSVITGLPSEQINSYFRSLTGSPFKPVSPVANWDKFPIENYWKYKLAHGPLTGEKYLPILSSYGCPWGCTFCVVPATNLRKWTPRDTQEIYLEIQNCVQKYGVREFHFEDLNSSVNSQRMRELGTLLQNLKITWKIVAGTKAETLDSFETLEVLFSSGLRYFSFSPESGSSSVRKEIGKRFNVIHSLRLIRWSRKLGIQTQACFVLGMPTEHRLDRLKTLSLIRLYTMLGVDEIALFIISPMPGSELSKKFEVDLSRISFSPTWRADYAYLSLVRLYWYSNFLILKLVFHPIAFLKSVNRFFTKNFQLKMELAPFRSFQWKRWASEGLEK
jgi:hypothetical protein